MKKLTIILSLLLGICFFVFYSISTHDERTANNLSAYCNIDFIGINDTTTATTSGATLEIIDYRYNAKPLKQTFALYIDDKFYQFAELETSQLKPSYAFNNFNKPNFAKYQNRLFVKLPITILKEIKTAKIVKVSFSYLGATKPVILPLSPPDLKYWQNQLPYL